MSDQIGAIGTLLTDVHDILQQRIAESGAERPTRHTS